MPAPSTQLKRDEIRPCDHEAPWWPSWSLDGPPKCIHPAGRHTLHRDAAGDTWRDDA